MRQLLAALALVSLAAAPAHRAARDWTHTVGRTPLGAAVVGNPAAKVKLVEYVSYTCPHCAAFTAESAPTLQAQWVRSGQVSLEVDPAVREPLDLAAAMLVRCAGSRFAAAHDAVYAAQATWYAKGAQYAQANIDALNAKPVLARLRAVADASGLTETARAAGGITPARVDTCFATDADMNRVVQITGEAGKIITGTPSFSINGKFIGASNWAALELQLRAAGAR